MGTPLSIQIAWRHRPAEEEVLAPAQLGVDGDLQMRHRPVVEFEFFPVVLEIPHAELHSDR
jgi:hypothetical protein